MGVRTGIKEYGEGMEVIYDQKSGPHTSMKGTQILRAYTECGHDHVELDLLDILAWSFQHLEEENLLLVVSAANAISPERTIKLDMQPRPTVKMETGK